MPIYSSAELGPVGANLRVYETETGDEFSWVKWIDTDAGVLHIYDYLKLEEFRTVKGRFHVVDMRTGEVNPPLAGLLAERDELEAQHKALVAKEAADARAKAH
jgi:hypothetical protein